MTYQIKNGEEIRDGKLFGWTGRDCPHCRGSGESESDEDLKIYSACPKCGGTGEEWGLMPVQPINL